MSSECQKCNEHCLNCKCSEKEFDFDNAAQIILSCLDRVTDIKFLSPDEFDDYMGKNKAQKERSMHLENIEHPPHYQGTKLETIDIIEDFKLDFNLGNAVKYILRAGKKGSKLEDLQKAMWYLQRECQTLNKAQITQSNLLK